jgi:hypothetical protein
MTAIEEIAIEEIAGSLVRETGRISSEMEDTQDWSKGPVEFPRMKPKHLSHTCGEGWGKGPPLPVSCRKNKAASVGQWRFP